MGNNIERPHILNIPEGRLDDWVDGQAGRKIERVQEYVERKGEIALISPEILDEIARKLREKREKDDISLTNLAKKLRIDRKTLDKFEKRQGRFFPKTLIPIIKWLKLDLNELLKGNNGE